MPSPTVIRVSSLPSYPDCPRRDAARSRRDEVEAAGFSLRENGTSIGAAIGTATHAGLELGFRGVMNGEVFSKSVFEDKIASVLAEETSKAVIWDDTSRNLGDATRQATKQATIIFQAFGDKIIPDAIEERLDADLGDGFLLVGHIDLRGHFKNHDILKGGGLIDYKTGTIQRANAAQYGGYSLVARAHKIDVDWAAEIYTKRVGVTKPQPDPVLSSYDLAQAELGAFEIVSKIKSDLIDFRNTGNPWSFLPNPNSMNCNEKYCPAWGTNFCRAHKGEMK